MYMKLNIQPKVYNLDIRQVLYGIICKWRQVKVGRRRLHNGTERFTWQNESQVADKTINIIYLYFKHPTSHHKSTNNKLIYFENCRGARKHSGIQFIYKQCMVFFRQRNWPMVFCEPTRPSISAFFLQKKQKQSRYCAEWKIN